MANAQQTPFPTLQTIMDLARANVNDMYPGISGTSGRILTNAAPFTIPYVNSAIRTISRKLRNEGCTFPINDNVILGVMKAVASPSPNIQTYLSFDGFFDGVQMNATPKLPSDCLQVFEVGEQTAGTNLPFGPMVQPPGGLPSTFQGPQLGIWEWRKYRIVMVGSTNDKNIRIRYQSGQPPINTPADQFDDAVIQILDCEEAMAFDIAGQYARARGADPAQMFTARDAAIDDMAQEWVRRQQTENYRRAAYGGSGSNDAGTPLGPSGSVQAV